MLCLVADDQRRPRPPPPPPPRVAPPPPLLRLPPVLYEPRPLDDEDELREGVYVLRRLSVDDEPERPRVVLLYPDVDDERLLDDEGVYPP